DMRSTRVILLFLVVAMGVSCGAIPPYSSVKKQSVRGFHTLKMKTSALATTDMHETTLSTNSATDPELYDTSSSAIELERVLKDQLTTVFSIHKRVYTVNDSDAGSINGNQIHAGMRRYFGDRALTAFIAVEGIYSFNFNHPELGIDLENGPGWAVGGGVNFALNESFSIEASLFRETIWAMGSHQSSDSGLSADYEHSFKSTIGYIGLGFHF
ncbi:MAG: hypothetical protein ACKVK0_15360, partial [Pirellulales bacterium]